MSPDRLSSQRDNQLIYFASWVPDALRSIPGSITDFADRTQLTLFNTYCDRKKWEIEISSGKLPDVFEVLSNYLKGLEGRTFDIADESWEDGKRVVAKADSGHVLGYLNMGGVEVWCAYYNGTGCLITKFLANKFAKNNITFGPGRSDPKVIYFFEQKENEGITVRDILVYRVGGDLKHNIEVVKVDSTVPIYGFHEQWS